MVGFAGSLGGSFDQLQVVCGSLALDGAAVTTGEGDTLPLRGENLNEPVSGA